MTDKAKIKLGVLLSGGGRTLLNLLDKIEAGELIAEVVTVIASRECDGIERCRARGLDVHLVEYSTYGEERLEDYSDAIRAILDAAGAELVLMAGFLSKWIIPDAYTGRVLNIHPALLPKYGGKGMYGMNVHRAIIAAGDLQSGCTVHFVTNEYDAGPIILQRTVRVNPVGTPEMLAKRVFEQECYAYPEAIQYVADGDVKMVDGKAVFSEE
ncbi:MAG: phosphoribosylglycinamide formyltransferase [Phycisphaerales bacterium]|jgi:phosphoribosylglycinamide formyltransferase 1|nr:phosphoribosylglycinamide formyltransferase [Phycisphaerales bacterium]MBT7170172.1 phosphoribosylglycinamide formyltransferase [Phycisphaerales bacterium]